MKESYNKALYWIFTPYRAVKTSALGVILRTMRKLILVVGGGVFRWTGKDGHWTEINSGLSNIAVLSLTIDSKGYILAGTAGGGVFRSTRSTTSFK